jgi:hypothetical protein
MFYTTLHPPFFELKRLSLQSIVAKKSGKMSAVLINQKIYPELQKLGITSATLDLKNRSLRDHILQAPDALPVLGMTLFDADQVVRWSIDYTLGLASMPQSILSTVRLPTEISPVGVGDPIETGGFGGLFGSKIGPLGHILPAPAAEGLITSARISDGLRKGQAPASLNALKIFVAPNSDAAPFKLNAETTLLKANFNSEIGLGGARPFEFDSRPDWEKNPQLYKFPAGFPRTYAEKQLAYQTTGLITAFGKRSDKISSKLTSDIKNNTPNWRLPDSTNVNFADETARFSYLGRCDSILQKSQVESYGIVAEALTSFPEEAALFLAATKEYVFCSHEIFEQYWEGQYEAVTQSAFSQLNSFLSRQTLAVNHLKTQLSQLNFDQQQAQAAADAARQNENGSCDIIKAVGSFVGIVVVGVVIVLAAAFGGRYDPYPNSGSYGPVDPNDPTRDDPSHPESRP